MGRELSAFREDAEEHLRQQRQQIPRACPRPGCGEPLVGGQGGILKCKWDGWEYPRDYDPEVDAGF